MFLLQLVHTSNILPSIHLEIPVLLPNIQTKQKQTVSIGWNKQNYDCRTEIHKNNNNNTQLQIHTYEHRIGGCSHTFEHMIKMVSLSKIHWIFTATTTTEEFKRDRDRWIKAHFSFYTVSVYTHQYEKRKRWNIEFVYKWSRIGER